MAILIDQKTLTTNNPPVYGRVDYSAYRSGNYMVYVFTVYMWITDPGGWRNNRWAAQLNVNNQLIWDNQTIKPRTSGAIGTDWKGASTGELWYPINWGTIPIWVHFADTGSSSEWSIYNDWGIYYGDIPTIAPWAPSKPSNIWIPQDLAPDKWAYITWSESAGGTNGVSGYQLGISNNGGASYTYVLAAYNHYEIDLALYGFVQGSALKCMVRSYTIVNDEYIYSDWQESNIVYTYFQPPTTPSAINIPSSVAPDKWVNINWSESFGGTNGVAGYTLEVSKDGGYTWQVFDVFGTENNYDLNANGFVQGSRLRARVRAFTIGQNNRYYSDYQYSSITDTLFVAPGKPTNLNLSYNTKEPIPTAAYTVSWNQPQNTGTNGIGGYKVRWQKNGVDLGYELDTKDTYITLIPQEEDLQPGDLLGIKVSAYTIGQGDNYFSEISVLSGVYIVSDKFIKVSQNGGEFTKYKMYISVDGDSFKEIKKEKFKIL